MRNLTLQLYLAPTAPALGLQLTSCIITGILNLFNFVNTCIHVSYNESLDAQDRWYESGLHRPDGGWTVLTRVVQYSLRL